MSSLFADGPQPFVEPEEKGSIWRCWLGIVLSIIVIFAGVVQTQLFITIVSNPNIESIREHIAVCKGVQGLPATEHSGAQIDFKLFDDDTKKNLEAVRESLLNDESLQTELRDKYGTSFSELKVIIVPAWKLITNDNNDLVGITDDGWTEARKAIGAPDVGGITLRNRPQLSKRTTDGRPRIVMNTAAFGNLRLTLFHELEHAMNVPGYYPSPVTFAQNDLVYLPQYRDYVSREHLDDWHERKIWLLAVGTPFLILVLICLRLRRLRRRLAQ